MMSNDSQMVMRYLFHTKPNSSFDLSPHKDFFGHVHFFFHSPIQSFTSMECMKDNMDEIVCIEG